MYGSLSTLQDEIISQKDTRNHPPDDAEVQAEKIVNSIRAKAWDTIRPIPGRQFPLVYALNSFQQILGNICESF